MPKADDELQKHTLNLYKGDYERIQALNPDIGAGPIIRRVLRKFLTQIENSTDSNNPDVDVKL